MARWIYNNPHIDEDDGIVGQTIIAYWMPGKFISVVTSKTDGELASIWGWEPYQTCVARCNKYGMMKKAPQFTANSKSSFLYEKSYKTRDEALAGHEGAVKKFS